MNLLDIAPILSPILGVFLCLFIWFSKSGLGKDKVLRLILLTLVFLYTFIAFDYYLVISTEGTTSYFGISDTFTHLTGFLFYYFIIRFTKNTIQLKKWIAILVIYTLLRWVLFIPVLKYNDVKAFIAFSEQSDYIDLLYLEYIITSLINIVCSVLAFIKLRQTPTVVDFNEKQIVQYKWLQLVLVGFIALLTGIFINNMTGDFSLEGYTFSLKIDTLLIVLFFFVFAFSIMQFPVFAYTGDFEDLSESVKKKYVKSSLTDSTELFNDIEHLVTSERLYLEFDLKLNTLAERLDKSIHHVSQAINQSAGVSFPDYINRFRIEEAKKKLLEPKPDTIYAISLDVGFNSKAAFYTAFKKFTNQTPTAFKKAHKK